MGQTLYYVTLTACGVGCVLRIFLAGYYKLLLKSLKQMKTTKNKLLLKLKEQFILRYQAMLGVQNVEVFVGRFLAERKVFGITLSAWNGLHIQLVSLCLLGGSLGALYRCIHMEETETVLMAMFQGIWTSAVLLLVDGFCMIPGKKKALREGIADYLENYLQVRLEHEYEIWGKNKEEMRQTRQALEAQQQIIDEKNYRKEKKELRRKKKKPERRVDKDIVMLKKEVAERRRKSAQEAMEAELEKKVSGSPVDEILNGLALHL